VNWSRVRVVPALTVALALVVPSGAAAATTFDVAPGGSGGACTEVQPCNIVFALGAATSGDTVLAAGDQGSYGLPTSPTAAPIDVPDGVTLRGKPGGPQAALYTEATGFGSLEVGNGGSLIDFAVHEEKSLQLAVYGNGESTLERVLALGDGGAGCTVAGNSTITDSVCSGDWGLFESMGGSGQAVTLQLRNDTFYGTSQQGAFFGANNLILLPEAVNTIFLGAAGGVRVDDISAATVEVAASHSSYSGVTQENGATMTPEGTLGNQTAAPLLVDPAAGDFHEAAGSPTIDAALPSPADGVFDLDGNARSLPASVTCTGSGPSLPDIGAYEYVPPTPTCTVGSPSTPGTGGSATATTSSPSMVTTPTALCTVPKLVGKKLKAARKVVRRADCRLGKVTKEKGFTASAAKVVKQRPSSGTARAAGSKVAVKVG
jgi:PASTA domain